MKNMLNELYNGRIPGWDRKPHSKTDYHAFLEKVTSENKYFSTIMSKEDFKRFKALQNFHKEFHTTGYKNTYIKAFRLGVMLMFTLFIGEGL